MPLWQAIDAGGQSADVAGHSSAGPVRADNEDWFLVDHTLGLFAVADGMGGHRAGEVASHLAVQSLADGLREAGAPHFDWPFGQDVSSPPGANELRHAVLRANATVFARGESDPELGGMGTTLTALVLGAGRATIASVGDSRAYRVRGEVAEQLTRDDTWLVSVLGLGAARDAAARAHPMRHVLTSVIGSRNIAAPEVVTITWEPGDVFVLTTDGIHNVVDDATIARVTAPGPARIAAERLVQEAIARRTTDNVTAVVVRVGRPS